MMEKAWNFILLYEAVSCSCCIVTQQSGSHPSVDHMSTSSLPRIGQGNHLFQGKEGSLVPLYPLFPHRSDMCCSCERWCCYWKVVYQQLGIKEKKTWRNFSAHKDFMSWKMLVGVLFNSDTGNITPVCIRSNLHTCIFWRHLKVFT